MFIVSADLDGTPRSVPVLVIHEGDIRPDGRDDRILSRDALSDDAAVRIAAEWRDTAWLPLLRHAFADARESSVYAGGSPERWSPLGTTFRGFEEIADVPRRAGSDITGGYDDIGLGPQAVFDIGRVNGHTMVGLSVAADGDPGEQPQRLGAGIYAHDAFVVGVRPGATSVDFAYRPDAGAQSVEVANAEAALRAWLPDGELTWILVWRAYTGENTTIRDGATKLVNGAARLWHDATRHASALVGRIFIAIHSRKNLPRQDPFMARRLRRAEQDAGALAHTCPRIAEAPGSKNLVVAVHGAMATAIPMAQALHPVIKATSWHLCRYEHDTWLSIGTNAYDLSDHIDNMRPEPRRVLLVAHSRGGLVARQAAEILADRTFEVRVLSLGAPYLGTPIVSAAAGGLIGVRSLLRSLRVVPGTGPLIDAGLQVGALLVKDLPAGLAAMDPQSLYIDAMRHRPLTKTWPFAGDFTDGANGFGPAAMSGLSASAFQDEPNDLVVSTRSATVGSPRATRLTCDHFSYLLQPEVMDRLQRLLRARRPRTPWQRERAEGIPTRSRRSD